MAESTKQGVAAKQTKQVMKRFGDLTKEEKKKFLNENKLWFFQLIITYKSVEQQVCEVIIKEVGSKSDMFESLVKELQMDAEELDDLVKISTCMYYGTDGGYPKFLNACRGKFYFNADLNHDADTIEMDTLRKKLADAMRCS